MKWRKAASSLLAVSLAVTQLAAGTAALPMIGQIFAEEVSAEQNSAVEYFYQQLPAEAKVFYDAMSEMHAQGLLQTGNADFDLTANGYLTQEQARAYAGGGANVLDLFGAARDAFDFDMPDLFYVDFSLLSLRVTVDENGGCHVYIGTGRSDSYYAEGFTDAEQVAQAIAEYEAAADQIAAEAASLTAGGDKSLTAEQVKYVHDYITHHVAYRLEDACAPENIGLIRTSYGALVRGEAVCEGYARAFKSVLDRLEIPCVLVQGAYLHNANTPELHMWTEVQLDGLWYGTDVTMDDPVSKNPTDNGVDGYENDELLLVGSHVMDQRHKPSGIVSAANFEFSYPALTFESYGISTVANSSGLVVRYRKDGEFEDLPAGEFYISYQGMGCAKAAEQGKYLLTNYAEYDEENDTWSYSGWCYITPELYPVLAENDSDTELCMPMPQVEYVQFGVTDIPYGTIDYNGYEIPDLYFHGDPYLLDASTDMLYNENGSYVAPPYPQTVTPSVTGKLSTGQTYHVSVTYNDTLVRNDDDLCLYVTAENAAGEPNTAAPQNASFTNLKWDGESTLTFDFQPSQMWADDNVFYQIVPKGLVGKKSGKAPVAIGYAVAVPQSYCCMRANGYNWNLVGQPTLLDNSDLSVSDWQTADGELISDQLKFRMALVASTPTHAQTDTMNEMIASETDDTILSSQTFNINLTVCKAQVVKTGEAVRVMLGFPEGYGPDDAGVTFKAYHFIKNAQDEITGVEEIPCTVTKYGLVLFCQSFSPYAVVAVADDGTQTASQKSIIAANTLGGTVCGAEGIPVLNEGETLTLSVQADEGYVIETITVDGKYAEISDSSAMELTVSYDDIAGSSGIIDVRFTAASVIEKDAARGETAVHVDADADALELSPVETTTTETTTTTTETTTATETTTTTSVTTETSEPVTTTAETTTVTDSTAAEESVTTAEETTGTTASGELPQTGYPRAMTEGILWTALMLLGAGCVTVRASGAAMRRKDESTAE